MPHGTVLWNTCLDGIHCSLHFKEKGMKNGGGRWRYPGNARNNFVSHFSITTFPIKVLEDFEHWNNPGRNQCKFTYSDDDRLIAQRPLIRFISFSVLVVSLKYAVCWRCHKRRLVEGAAQYGSTCAILLNQSGIKSRGKFQIGSTASTFDSRKWSWEHVC